MRTIRLAAVSLRHGQLARMRIDPGLSSTQGLRADAWLSTIVVA